MCERFVCIICCLITVFESDACRKWQQFILDIFKINRLLTGCYAYLSTHTHIKSIDFDQKLRTKKFSTALHIWKYCFDVCMYGVDQIYIFTTNLESLNNLGSNLWKIFQRHLPKSDKFSPRKNKNMKIHFQHIVSSSAYSLKNYKTICAEKLVKPL